VKSGAPERLGRRGTNAVVVDLLLLLLLLLIVCGILCKHTRENK
jgi:hypothetical protein